MPLRLALILTALTGLVCAQGRPQPQPEVTIKAFTRLVQVPVIVTGDGKHVQGLTQDDFVLFEDKKEQRIATFEAVTTSTAPVNMKKLPPGVYSNLLVGGQGARSVSVIVMDAVNTAFPDQAYARYQLIKYLTKSVEPGMLVSLVVLTRNGMKVIHDYTTDTSVLIKAVQKMKARGDAPTPTDLEVAATAGTDPMQSLVDEEAADLEAFTNNADQTVASFQRAMRVMDTIAAMESLVKSLAGVPGRKSLIWATGSFPFYFDDNKGFSSADFADRMSRLFQSLNDANIAIYPVDVRGLVIPGFSVNSTVASAQARNPALMAQSQMARSRAFQNTLDTLRNAAELTGGIAYYNTNDIAGSIRRAQDDASSFYLLGYYLKGGEKLPQYRKIEVKVKKPGLKARSRKGVFAVPPLEGERQKRQDLRASEYSPLPFTGIAMGVHWPGYKQGSAEQPFEMRMDTNDLQLEEETNNLNLEILAVARDAEGNLLDQVNRTISGKVKDPAQLRKQPLIFTDRFHLTSTPATIHFVARDNNSGKMGSVIVQKQ